VLPEGIELLDALPPHIDRPWKRFDAAATELQKFRGDRASAQADEAHAASDEKEQRMKVLEGDRAKAVIAGFGGGRHVQQLRAAHARYGKAFGFTAVVVEPVGGPTDGRPQWVTTRDALRTLVQKIESYADPDIEGSEALVSFLLGPYVEMVVDLEKSRRASRTKKPEGTPNTP
jgi:hypothetical protein